MLFYYNTDILQRYCDRLCGKIGPAHRLRYSVLHREGGKKHVGNPSKRK
jgi:hypothetical protein